MNQLCKLVAKDPLRPKLGATWNVAGKAGITTEEQHILEDAKYGKLALTSDGKLRYILLNRDIEITTGEAVRAINAAMMEWQTSLGIDFVQVHAHSLADIKIQFQSSIENQIFRDEPNVLAYMYYPIAGALKGVMMINADYAWTPDGEQKSGRWIQEKTGRKVQWLDNMYDTWSLFKVTRHELGHGIGLCHTLLEGHTMSGNYSKMAKHNTSLDEKRGQAKYGTSKRKQSWLSAMKDRLMRKFGK